jgi:DNA-binding NarL/FixJ family response regulator
MPRLLLLQNDAAIGEQLRRTIAGMPDMAVSDLTLTLAQALGSLQASPADLVLLDLQVNRGDCTGLLEELASRPRESRPAVLVGALSLEDPALMEAISQGADGYYLHGGSVQTLREAIAQVLAGESPMAPAIARQAKSRFESPAWESAAIADVTRDALRLSQAQLCMLERIGEGYLPHEIARELQTTEHDVGLGIRTLYRKLQFERRAASMAGQMN